MSRQLTEMQKRFLDCLFEEAQGDLYLAKRLAGYSDKTPVSDVTAPIKDEIVERTKDYIARSATRAAFSMYGVLSDPTKLGSKELMVAAKDILDRAGFVKTDKVEVEAKTPIFYLPTKKEDTDDE